MPLQLETCSHSKDIKIPAPENDNHIFESKDDLKRSIKRLDLYVIGKIWVEGMKMVLVGSKMSLIPVVQAARGKAPDPEKPKPMKYKELPLYGTPHADYQAFADEKRCKTTNTKILQQKVVPYVRNSRRYVSKTVDDAVKEIKPQIQCTANAIKAKKKEMLDMARDNDKLMVRYGVVATGALGGFMLARKKYILKRMFATSIGAMAAGALCFPSETDEILRNFCHRFVKGINTLWAYYRKVDPPVEKAPIPCKIPPFVQKKRDDSCAKRK